jgi:integrase
MRSNRCGRDTLAAPDHKERVMSKVLLDAAGRRRSPATMPGFHAGRPPRNKGRRYPADPPTVTEIVAVMRQAGDDHHGRRLRALIVVLWRAGLRIHEALALNEGDLDPRRGSVLVRRGKGGRRRQVGMDDWAWEQLEPWLKVRVELPVGPLQASDGASRRTSSATHTPSKWPAKVCRYSSSSANSDTPTSASPPSNYKASIAPRSSTPSTPDALPWSPSTARYDPDARVDASGYRFRLGCDVRCQPPQRGHM